MKNYLFIAIIAIGIISCMPSEQKVQKEMQKVENQVANDAVKQYEIAKKNGSAMDAYVQASMVAAAFLQAKDEENYKKWKEIEKKEAKLAGVPVE